MIHFVGMETKENRNRLTGVVWWWHVYPPPPSLSYFSVWFLFPLRFKDGKRTAGSLISSPLNLKKFVIADDRNLQHRK
jgi:hypothetical protein